MNFVLVHGACHGGWCWKPLENLLRSQGHEFYRPSLTGMGDRAHLLTPDVTVQAHIDDIANNSSMKCWFSQYGFPNGLTLIPKACAFCPGYPQHLVII